MNSKFVGIELRNVEMEGEEFSTRYVDKDSIVFHNPEADFSSEDAIFAEACDYLENNDKDVVSCDQAKVNEVYYSKG